VKRILGEFPIFDRETNTECIAKLCSPICPEHVDDFENFWKPAMIERRRQLTSSAELMSANLQDLGWHWREKQAVREKRMEWESFAIEYNDVTQAMMFVRTQGFALAPGQEKMPLIYIDLVSVAPWNRKGFTPKPKYKGLGPILMGTAISLSVSEGCAGRVGLHSLPQSENFYRDYCKMSELAPDPAKESLVYFEFTPEQAQDFLNN